MQLLSKLCVYNRSIKHWCLFSNLYNYWTYCVILQKWEESDGRKKQHPCEPVYDSDSACSVGGSNTDSGRGSHEDPNITDPVPGLNFNNKPVLSYRCTSVPTRDLTPGIHKSPAKARNNTRHSTVGAEHEGSVPTVLDYRRESYRHILDKSLEERELANRMSNALIQSQNTGAPPRPPRLHNNVTKPIQSTQPQAALQLTDHTGRKGVQYCSQV